MRHESRIRLSRFGAGTHRRKAVPASARKKKNDPDAAFNLAMLLQDRKTQHDTREAAALYQVAIEQDDSRWDAWANLAAALSELQNDPLRAISAYSTAILLIEQLADEAQDACVLSQLYYGYGLQLAELSPSMCSQLASRPDSLLVGECANGDGNGQINICLENAQNALRTSVVLNPENVQANHMLAALASDSARSGSEFGLSKASSAFVEALFDDFADTFDDRLVDQLQYVVPELVGDAAAALKRSLKLEKFSFTLDAGCGTGLAGPHLRDLTQDRLVGVDISKEMIARAKKLVQTDNGRKPVYDSLISLDLLEFEAKLCLPEGEKFDLIIAADVLVYFGDLADILLHFSNLSRPGAGLIFSCERIDDDETHNGWKILQSGRFAQSKEYVVRVAQGAGYKLDAYEEIVPRMEGNRPVPGHLFTLIKKY